MDNKTPPKDFIDQLNEDEASKRAAQDKQAELSAINKAGIKNVEATNANAVSTANALKNVKGEVKVTNPDLAKSSDVANTVDAINKLNLTTFNTNQGLPALADNLVKLTEGVKQLQAEYQDKGLGETSKQLTALVDKLESVGQTLSGAKVEVDTKLQKTIDSLSKSIDSIDFKPQVNVAAPATKVVTTPIDLTLVVTALKAVETAVSTQEKDTPTDLNPVVDGLASVQNAITSLRFPVPNYVLPFRDANGKDTQIQLTSAGTLPTSGGLITAAYDYVGVTYPDGVTEVYVYKTGGSGGTTVATVTMVYTDSTKASISTITKV